MINAEVSMIRDSGMDGDVRERSIGDLSLVLEDSLGRETPNIVEDRSKLNWLADWALKDLRVSSPSELLGVVASLDSEALRKWPRYRMVDRVYMAAREQQALKMMAEVRRA